MIKQTNIIISLKKEFETFEVTFTNVDVSLEQYFNAFKGMLVSAGWYEVTINDYILEMSEELKEE